MKKIKERNEEDKRKRKKEVKRGRKRKKEKNQETFKREWKCIQKMAHASYYSTYS
jgi:hypothetical protein